MLLVDDILLSPIAGLKFVFRTLIEAAEREWTDDADVKNRLMELQLKLESGEITEQQYTAEEAELFRELREIQQRRKMLAGGGPRSSGEAE